MIRINLLPVKRSKKRDAATRELIMGAIVVGVVVFGLYVWYAMMESSLEEVRDKTAKVEQEVKDKENEIVKVDVFKKQKSSLEAKVAVINDLRARKTGPVKMLDELATNIPRRAWLTAFDEKNGTMTLDGGTSDNDDLADLLSYLMNNSKYFSNIRLAFNELVPPSAAVPGYVRFKLTGTAQYGTLPVAPGGAK
jgi:type IV pilus assembly protein PilN